MMKRSIKQLLSGVALTLLVSTGVLAQAQVEIEWVEPEEFTDVRPSNESKKRFRERTLKNLERYITKLSKDLPENQILKLTVTDLDLAGRVQFGSSAVINTRFGFARLGNGKAGDIRIIDTIDFPRMDFSYSLTQNDGQVILSGEEVLKDLSFQHRVAGKIRNSDSLRYEKEMLRAWFNRTFESAKVDHQKS